MHQTHCYTPVLVEVRQLPGAREGWMFSLSEKTSLLYRASLIWDHGVIALKSHSYDVAEERLREASQLFERLKDGSWALVALDLTAALEAQGKSLEAVALAATTADYLATFPRNRVARAAVSELMGSVVRGRVSLDVVERVQEKLKPEHARLVRASRRESRRR